MLGLYVLVGKEPVRIEVQDLAEDGGVAYMDWAEWHYSSDRTVANDMVGDVEISTVFLGLDHNLMGTGPRLFETMVFGGPFDRACRRYATWDEAEKGHAEIVDGVKAAQPMERKE